MIAAAVAAATLACLGYGDLTGRLARNYGEVLADSAAIDGRRHVEVWRHPDGRSFSVVAVAGPCAALLTFGGVTDPLRREPGT